MKAPLYDLYYPYDTLFENENEWQKTKPVPIPLPRASRNFPDAKKNKQKKPHN